MIELAKELQIKKIYTIDEKLAAKVRDVKIENPIPKDVMEEYHRYGEYGKIEVYSLSFIPFF